MYNKKTFIALSTATVIGLLGLASTALANDIDESASAAQVTREMHGNPLPWWWNSSNQGSGSYAYQPVQPSLSTHGAPRK